MQTKIHLHLFRESCACFSISSAFREENLLIWVGTCADPTDDHPYAMQRL
jgi:hypothetical protein